MSNILFLFGNGFDINLGLCTSFNDILNEYINFNKKTKNKYIKKFMENINKYPNEWANFEKQLGIYSKYFNSKNKNIFIEQINSFREVMKNKITYEESRIKTLDRKEHIINEFFYNSISNIINYLPENSKKYLEKLTIPSDENNSFTYNFINFNYTKTLEKCLKVLKEIGYEKLNRTYNNEYGQHKAKIHFGKILYIHGTLNEYFILGVDNKNQILNKSFKNDEDMQFLIKPYQNNIIGENNEIKAKQIIDNSNIICVFGMAIGETDKTWWNYIYNWLKTNNYRHLILFIYNKEINIDDVQSIDIHIRNVINKFYSVLDNIDDKTVRDRIHIPFKHQNMFKINLIDDIIEIKDKQLISVTNNIYDKYRIVKNIDMVNLGETANKINELSIGIKKFINR